MLPSPALKSARQSCKSMVPSSQRRRRFERSKLSMGIGYQVDFSVSDKHPFYIGTGVNMMVTTRSKTYYDDAQYNLVNIKQRTTFINFNIPVNFNVRLPLYGGWTVTPSAGLNFRIQAYGHNR